MNKKEISFELMMIKQAIEGLAEQLGFRITWYKDSVVITKKEK